MWDRAPSFSELQDAIRNPQSPIGMRMRAAYFLKQSHANDPSTREAVVETLQNGILDERHGSLMRHEFAYVMGQMQDERCCDVLEKILRKSDDCSMVRHEAAEALAAIGKGSSRKVLEEVMEATKQCNLMEVSDTCRLALNVMEWRDRGDPNEELPVACACMLNPYSSVDPAPPHPAHASMTMSELGDILCNPQLSIFDRYRAMFSLRNRGGEEAVLEICRALETDESSALLRHELAYVLGQMQHSASVPALEASLRLLEEHQMVRHESAEALGAIEGSWDKVEAILAEFCKDENQVVRESCLVALDAADYWGHNNTSIIPEDDEEEQSESRLSFVQQKADLVKTAFQNDGVTAHHVLNEHFNVQS